MPKHKSKFQPGDLVHYPNRNCMPHKYIRGATLKEEIDLKYEGDVALVIGCTDIVANDGIWFFEIKWARAKEVKIERSNFLEKVK